MSFTNFTPQIWSETLLRSLDETYIGVKNCNREFESQLKGKGGELIIEGVGNIRISDYTKDTDLSSPQTLDSTTASIKIDQAKCFNFQIDDIDSMQGRPNVMAAAMKSAARSLADAADKYIYSLCVQASDGDEYIVNEDNIFDAFFNTRKKFYDVGVSDSSELIFEVSPEIAGVILKAKANKYLDNKEIYEKGCIGSIFGSKVFVSKNITSDDYDSGAMYNCFARTKRAIAFVESISEICAYRPEKRFADAIKGLHTYGASVVYPGEFMMMHMAVDRG